MFFPLFQSAISISGIDGVMSSSSSMYGCSRNRDLFLGPTSLLGPLVALGQKMNNSGFQQMWSSRETSLHLEPLISLFSLIPDFSCLFSLAKRAIANSAHALFTSGCKSLKEHFFFLLEFPIQFLKPCHSLCLPQNLMQRLPVSGRMPSLDLRGSHHSRGPPQFRTVTQSCKYGICLTSAWHRRKTPLSGVRRRGVYSYYGNYWLQVSHLTFQAQFFLTTNMIRVPTLLTSNRGQ